MNFSVWFRSGSWVRFFRCRIEVICHATNLRCDREIGIVGRLDRGSYHPTISIPTQVGGANGGGGVGSAGEPNRTSRPHVLVRPPDRAPRDRGDPRRGARTRFVRSADNDAVVLPSRARDPGAAPLRAADWILAAGISFVDPLLIPYPESIFLLGLVAAFLLGNLRDGWRAGLGLV